MTIEQSIRQHLTSVVALTGLVSTRIYFWRAFQTSASSDYPYIVFMRLAGTRPDIHSPANPEIIESIFQFDVWAKNADEARSVERQLRRGLEGFPGSTGYNATRFRVDVPQDGWQPEPEFSFRTVLTARCWHTDD